MAAIALLLLPGYVHAAGRGEPEADSYREQLPPVTLEYAESEERARYSELLREYGTNKELPVGYELQALLALSHYPELADVRIRFVIDDVDIPISSRPRPISTFRTRWRRLYLVVIDTDSQRRGALLLKNQPFNAQVGILGHELAHTAYYVHRSFFGIVGDALCQLSDDCRREFERATDRRLIEHNLGWQRYHHSSFVRAGFRAEEVEAGSSNNDASGGTYMDPPQLLEVMEQSGLYDVSRADEVPPVG